MASDPPRTTSGSQDLITRYDAILKDPALAEGVRHIHASAERLSIEVAGERTEARAWRDAVHGLLRPPWTDRHGRRHWLIIGRQIVIDVVAREAGR
ncbi:hypothetical protein [Kribbella sindirgiensis]|uniref:Uncharacterized protein n=1 Tax=Kribbella sindirgiensis TaxID=1124744 RepID=A0A4R0IQN1_9ACTN|nr:hypothetical protein [Kribbella sindirgiensis]TCC34900.1 hypothetical protein E0H50_13485 [Kribbella sindirgiensis]